MPITAIDYVKISSGRLLEYRYLEGYNRKANKTSFGKENFKNGTITGKLSDNSKKRIKKIVITWLSTVQFYLMSKGFSLKETGKYIKFITLTLPSPQVHTDKEIKQKMLNRFLTYLKRNHGLRNYLWIAETQKNGNLHFHIVTNSNIHYKIIQKIWNNILADYTYIDTFARKHGHRQPPTTDIHVLKKIKNLSAYLTKEVTKGQQSRAIEGKLWGCNKSLMKLTDFETIYTPDLDRILYALKEREDLEVFKDNFFAVYFYESLDIFEFLNFKELPELYEHYKEMMNILFYDSNIDDFIL